MTIHTGMRPSLALYYMLVISSIFLIGLSCGANTKVKNMDRKTERHGMVDQQITARGIQNPAILEAMRSVPRHRFVPDAEAPMAYHDGPLPIGHSQTISQPYIVAFMTEALDLHGSEKVLEIGTGSGYQAAVLAEVASKVFSIEIVEPLAKQAAQTLQNLGYTNVTVRTGDGYQGWAEEAPFDAIIVTAAPDHIPQPLLDQLSMGGRLILPMGKYFQELILIRRTPEGFTQETLLPVVFVPMTGQAEKGPPSR